MYELTQSSSHLLLLDYCQTLASRNLQGGVADRDGKRAVGEEVEAGLGVMLGTEAWVAAAAGLAAGSSVLMNLDPMGLRTEPQNLQCHVSINKNNETNPVAT